VIGRPILYKTTKEFLLRFGLKDVSELPSMEEFEKMAADMAESDASDLDAVSAESATVTDTDVESSDASVTETVTEARSTVEISGESSGSEP
jgi:segregation and condensation protein B